MRDVLSPQLIRRLFEAQSIALLGASDDPTRIGGRPLRLLRKFGFSGMIVPINVHRSVVQGERSYPSLRDVPHPVDLAIVALRADLVPKSISDCIDLGVGSIVVYTSGLGELGSEGGEVEFQMASLAEKHNVALLGPNCLGALDVHRDLPLTFSAVLERGMPKKGSLGIVSQSGAIGMTILAACRERSVGISKWISTGNEASLNVADGIAALAGDDSTSTIACYLESTRAGRSLRTAFQLAADAGKQVILLRGGRSSQGATAAASHTGALAARGGAFDAVCAESGVVQVSTLRELGNAVYGTQRGRRLPGAIAVVTLSGGLGVMAADAASAMSVALPEIAETTQAELRELVPNGYVGNPIDLTGSVISQPTLIADTVELVVSGAAYSTIVYNFAHNGLDPALLDGFFGPLKLAVTRSTEVNHVFTGLTTSETRAKLENQGLIVVDEPADGIFVASLLSNATPAGTDTLHAVAPEPLSVADWNEIGPPWNEVEVKDLLRRIGIPTPRETVAWSVADAVGAAAVLGQPTALKVVSRQLVHKAAAGGVRLNVEPEQAEVAYQELVRGAEQAGYMLEGVLVTGMYQDTHLEVILGITRDPFFGPMLLLGLGGTFADVLGVSTMGSAPMDMAAARRWIQASPVFGFLSAQRDGAKLDVEALIAASVNLSRLALMPGDWETIEINPLLVGAEGEGVIALDAVAIAGH